MKDGSKIIRIIWKNRMRKQVLPPEDTLSANLSVVVAAECFTPQSTPRNTVIATGAAIRPTIGGSGNTAKCAVRIWSASAAVKYSHPNVQMPAIAATPVGKKTIENVLRMLQVLKWYAPYNRDTEIGKGLKWANEKRSIQSLESGSLKNALQGECEDERLPDEQVFLPLQCESESACTKWMGLQHLHLQMPRGLIARKSRKKS